MTTPRTQQSEQAAGTGAGTPRTTKAWDESQTLFRKEYARSVHMRSVSAEMETELTAALRRITELEKESQSWKDAHGVAAFDRSQLEAQAQGLREDGSTLFQELKLKIAERDAALRERDESAQACRRFIELHAKRTKQFNAMRIERDELRQGILKAWNESIARWGVNHESIPNAFLPMAVFLGSNQPG